MLHSRFYDQVLAAIEIGQVRDGINQLAGMLDGLLDDATAFANAGAALQRHPLHNLLRQDPLAKANGHYPNFEFASAAISTTGRRVFEATSRLPFIRALRERQREAARQLELAWLAGHNICLIDGRAILGLSNPHNFDLSKTSFVMTNADDAAWVSKKLAQKPIFVSAGSTDLSESISDRFDVISANQISDKLSGFNLEKLIASLGTILTATGVITLSSILPDHLGSGWRLACHHQDLNCHSEHALATYGTAAGLESRIYHDATGCLAWCEFRTQFASYPRGKNHA